MMTLLNKLPEDLKKIIRQAAVVSGQAKMPAYLVGGCLRDLILGVKNFDLDITVEGEGILLAKKLAKKLKAELITHEQFKTATLILPNRIKVDVATTRQEKYSAPAVLPAVIPGRLRDDLKRRDFTINAMAVNISVKEKQIIIDPFAGQDDLAAGKIRILHDLSFKDDPTRILRAVRFSQRFDFEIEPHTLRLLKAAIGAGDMEKVNPHRMRDELILILKEPDPFKSLAALDDLGGLSFIDPALKLGKSARVLFKSIGRQLGWFAKNFPARRQLDNWLVYFAALLSPSALVHKKAILQRLGLRKGEIKRIMDYFQERKKLISVLSKPKVSPERIFSLLEPLSYETIILLSATSQNKNLKKYLSDFFEVYNGMRICVSGADLGGLGVKPGPEYQKIFAKVLAAKLNGRLKNRRDELALIRKLV
ncbi:MAG TPA: CCA tRNA nucleotidyltransferase [Candidatus Omnitrophota bacterium]|nr:CCA tRNA nucleotidyltransferase [Candidatus Omnitrophota bacterium]